MSKLFLIRKNYETFAGPMTLSEMKKAYQRMDFGTDDEVSGHCGPWVVLSDERRVEDVYPNVARIVCDDMLDSWGLSQHSAKRIIGDGSSKGGKKTRGSMMFLAFLFISISAAAAALYMVKHDKFSSKAIDGTPVATVEEAAQFLGAYDKSEFVNYMQPHVGDIVIKSAKSRSELSSWIPYLRAYAFLTDGVVPNLSPKYVMGRGVKAAPSSCSLRAWRRRWRASTKHWKGYLEGRKMPRAHWSRLLAWDAHWIKRRQAKGWVTPKNYYEGCLAIAYKALEEIGSEGAVLPGTTQISLLQTEYKHILDRVRWLHEVSRDGASLAATATGVTAPKVSVAVWSCQEAATNLAELEKCSSGFSGAEKWNNYTVARQNWNLIRIAIQTPEGPLSKESLAKISAFTPKLSASDHFTMFEYGSELVFGKKIVENKGNITKALHDAQSNFPNVKLAH